jgi:hypothetical protein
MSLLYTGYVGFKGGREGISSVVFTNNSIRTYAFFPEFQVFAVLLVHHDPNEHTTSNNPLGGSQKSKVKNPLSRVVGWALPMILSARALQDFGRQCPPYV